MGGFSLQAIIARLDEEADIERAANVPKKKSLSNKPIPTTVDPKASRKAHVLPPLPLETKAPRTAPVPEACKPSKTRRFLRGKKRAFKKVIHIIGRIIQFKWNVLIKTTKFIIFGLARILNSIKKKVAMTAKIWLIPSRFRTAH